MTYFVQESIKVAKFRGRERKHTYLQNIGMDGEKKKSLRLPPWKGKSLPY